MKDHMLLLKGGSLWDQVILNGMYTALSVEHFWRKVHRAIQKWIAKKCRSTLEILVKDDIVSVRPLVIRDEQLKERMSVYSRKFMNPSGKKS